MQQLPEKQVTNTVTIESETLLPPAHERNIPTPIPAKFRAVPQQSSPNVSTQQSDIEQIVFSLAILAEADEPMIVNHLRRIQSYTRILMQQLQDHPDYRMVLTHEYQPVIAQAALLHDIGKMHLPTELKTKTGSLSSSEFQMMCEHTLFGKKALMQVERVSKHQSALIFFAKQIIYSHHERWDGSGYPLGLKQQQIPVPARLMALADVYDGLISPKSYKSALSHREASEIILSDDASLFDPVVLQAFSETESHFEQIAKEYPTQ